MSKYKDIFFNVLGISKDNGFLEQFKGDWNRFCNAYKPSKRHVTKEDLQNSYKEDLQLPIQVKLGKNFGHFYEIYLKYKFIPDNRFFINLDEEFTTTIKLMHNILGINPYPETKDNNPDEAYNIRWRAIILIEYLQELSNKPLRYLGLVIFRITIFVGVPLTLLLNLIILVQNILIKLYV